MIAFEPVPSFYDIAMKNIDLNPDLAEKIILVNKGVSDKKEVLKIRYDFEGDEGASSYRDDGMFEVETLTIEDIVNDFHVSNLEKK
ncbi:MAG: hypothetical protein LBB45_09460 [Methanobrevibacter sp.]|nr:hypothetical protein [Candidatus Methanovirga basalitermitum]